MQITIFPVGATLTWEKNHAVKTTSGLFKLSPSEMVAVVIYVNCRHTSDDSQELRQELQRKEEIINRLQSDLEHIQLQRVAMEKVRYNLS